MWYTVLHRQYHRQSMIEPRIVSSHHHIEEPNVSVGFRINRPRWTSCADNLPRTQKVTILCITMLFR